jgi:TRAP-type C4-dicarboxylate transport system permease small subunit
MKFFPFITKVNKYFAIVSGILIGVVGLFATYEAISRGVFSRPTSWSSDLSRYIMIWAIFLGTASAFLDKTHISVDFVREMAGKKWGTGVQRGLSILGYLCTLVYILVLIWCSQDLFLEAIKEGKLTYGTIQISVAYLYLAMVIGSVLMALTVIPIIVGLVRKKDDYL